MSFLPCAPDPATLRGHPAQRQGDPQLVLDRLEPGTEIEVDAYRDLNGDSKYQRDEL